MGEIVGLGEGLEHGDGFGVEEAGGLVEVEWAVLFDPQALFTVNHL